MDELLLNSKGILDEIISLHDENGDVSSLLTKILGDKDDFMSSFISYKKNYFRNLFDKSIQEENYFSAINLANRHDFKTEKLNLDFSSSSFQKKYSDDFFKTFFDTFSKGESVESVLNDYLDFLSEQKQTPDFVSFNPLSSKNANLKATLGDTLLSVLKDKSYGVVGKCVTYFDFSKQSFVLEGNVHPTYCVRSDGDSFNIPDWTFQNGGGFNYHKSILPGNHLEFGGARYFLHQKGFVFFHHSGDFGEMSPYIAELAVKSSKGKLHPLAFNSLDGAEDYSSLSKQNKEHSFGRTFLRRVSSEAVNRIKHWNLDGEHHSDLFATVESNQEDPEDDLPF